MFSRILLPLDGSRDWEALVPHLVVLAHDRDCEVLVLEAVPFTSTLFEMPKALSIPEDASDTEFAERTVASVAAELRARGLRTRELVQIGTPTATISGVARRQNATLIVLAVRERAGFPGSLFQTLTEHVLRTSPTPIYAVPAVHEEAVEPPGVAGDVVIPIDGSGLSLQSVPVGAEFCRRLSGKLVFVHVLAPDSSRKRAQEALDTARRRSDQEGIPSEAVLREGDPATEILNTSLEHRAALIAMRTRLSRNEAHGSLGSVTVRVLRAARVPMLIVRKAPRLVASPVVRAAGPKG
jgi:nucleotide-binding universal stress UspA family protein